MKNVWRLNIKTAAKAGVNPRQLCIENNILGIGWRVSQYGNVAWEDYIAEAKGRYKSYGRSFTVAINAVKNRMQVGDICWTRSLNGDYYIGRITSDWRYASSTENLDADVVNIRSCEWRNVGTVDVVPGKVVNSYIARSTVQRVTGAEVLRYCQYLVNKTFQEEIYQLSKGEMGFLKLISSDDCEDIVALYMQKEHGFMVIPSSCKPSTASYEYVMKHPFTGEKAVAQVKKGKVDLNRDKYSSLGCLVYLLTTEGIYSGDESENVICLDPSIIENFARNNYKLMSDRIQNWIDYENEILNKP